MRTAGIYSVAMFHVGAKSALLRHFFMFMHKKALSVRSLAPSFQTGPACAGLRFGFGRRPESWHLYCWDSPMLASGDRDHILSGVFNQFLSEKSEPAE